MRLFTLVLVIMWCISQAALSASMADYTLGIFGNANMDDTIDEQDIEYVQGIIDGTNDETELADANYDGQIDEEDIAQIEQIIAGEETELTIIDSVDRIVTVKVPVENLMSLICENEVIRILGAQNKVVAVNKWEAELHTEDHPVMCNKPVIGSFSPGGVDYEKILEIAGQTEGQDIVITYGESYAENIEERFDSSNDIKVVKFTFNRPDKLVPQLKQLAVMLGESEIDRCQEYVNWRESIFEQIEDEVQEIPSEERVTVYYEESGEGHFDTSGRPNSSENVMIYIAGGKSISEDLSIDNPTVDPEWVLVNDPEVIVSHTRNAQNVVGIRLDYRTANDESSKLKLEDARQELMETFGIAGTKAAVNERVYFIADDLMYGPQQPVGVMYMAKWFHPKRFDDLDPEEENRRYWEYFMDLEYRGLYVYPEE